MSHKVYSSLSIAAALSAVGCFLIITFRPRQVWQSIIYYMPDITLDDVMYYNLTCIGWALLYVSSYYMASIASHQNPKSFIVAISRNVFSTLAMLFATRSGFQFFIYEKWTHAEIICLVTVSSIMLLKTIANLITIKRLQDQVRHDT
jgi:O-antigen ligase